MAISTAEWHHDPLLDHCFHKVKKDINKAGLQEAAEALFEKLYRADLDEENLKVVIKAIRCATKSLHQPPQNGDLLLLHSFVTTILLLDSEQRDPLTLAAALVHELHNKKRKFKNKPYLEKKFGRSLALTCSKVMELGNQSLNTLSARELLLYGAKEIDACSLRRNLQNTREDRELFQQLFDHRWEVIDRLQKAYPKAAQLFAEKNKEVLKRLALAFFGVYLESSLEKGKEQVSTIEVQKWGIVVSTASEIKGSSWEKLKSNPIVVVVKNEQHTITVSPEDVKCHSIQNVS